MTPSSPPSSKLTYSVRLVAAAMSFFYVSDNNTLRAYGM